MFIELNGKELELNFGIRFIKECDDKTKETITIQGIKQEFSQGLAKYAGALLNGDALALVEIIDCALWKEKGKYTMGDLYDWFDEVDDVDSLFNDIIKELENANSSKKVMKEAHKTNEEQEKKAQAIQAKLMNE